MLIDYEDTPASAVSRLRTLGVDDQAMRDRFAYVRPDGPLIDRQGRVAGHTMAPRSPRSRCRRDRLDRRVARR